MRLALLLGLGGLLLAVTISCLPLIDTTGGTSDPGKTLVIALREPTDALTVPVGTAVQIAWSASNLTGKAATVSLIVESRTNLARTVVADAIAVSGSGASGQFSWDTTGFAGPYVIYARIATDTRQDEARSTNTVTVDVAPTFEFTAPTTDAAITPGASPAQPVNIAWRVSDNNATLRIGLDADSDHTGDDAGNEITILEKDVTNATVTDDELDWEGKNTDGGTVAAGTYILFAVVSDGVNSDVVAEATGRITVREPNDVTPADVAVTDPNSNTTFLTTDASTRITFEINQNADTLVDLKIDTDDSHANGNETTLIAQRFVEAKTGAVDIDWDGNDANGAAVPDGIYRPFVIASTGSGTPKTVQANGLIFRRSDANEPLVALLEPATTQKVDPGTLLTIKWRDDVPALEGDNPPKATIRLVLDDDGDPTTTADQIVILADRDATPDGVQDSFVYQVPASTLTAGEDYTVIAFIDRDGKGNRSAAPAKVILNDPLNP